MLHTAPDFDQLDRRQLVDPHGTSFKDLRQRLTPRWRRVWAELLAGHATIVLAVAGIVAAERALPSLRPLTIAVGAVLLGYAMAYVMLFFHEAAHHNLVRDRWWNDLLANVLIGWLEGQDVRRYRAVHLDHHRYLGTPRDTERTYFLPLDARFVWETLTGLRLLAVLRIRDRVEQPRPAAASAAARLGPLLVAGVVHATILAGACFARLWALAGAWLLAVGIVLPFFGALRQVLEHRDEHARPDVDYACQPHGPVNRLFGDGPLASTLGGAGFNRHLLHHWEPQISYTRLGELEAFLLTTHAAAAVRRHQTTYLATLRRLLVRRDVGA